MVRINLLPPEILEKRKFEKRIVYVGLAALLVAVVLLGVWGALWWQVNQRNAELQSNLELANQFRKQAEAYKVFEDKETALGERLATAETALAGRVDWGRITNELSLVLPSDVWLTMLEGDQEGGLSLTGSAIDSDTDVPDVGHKAVAKTLVRLADLELVNNVWLITSEKTEYEDTGKHVIAFEISTGIKMPAAPDTSSSSVPAPPSQ